MSGPIRPDPQAAKSTAAKLMHTIDLWRRAPTDNARAVLESQMRGYWRVLGQQIGTADR